MPPFDTDDDTWTGSSDEEHYLVFSRIPNIHNRQQWELVRFGDEIGHEHALNEAIKSEPIERNYPVEFLTVNTTSANVRHWKAGITVEELG
jgi:hypothetical protein